MYEKSFLFISIIVNAFKKNISSEMQINNFIINKRKLRKNIGNKRKCL